MRFGSLQMLAHIVVALLLSACAGLTPAPGDRGGAWLFAAPEVAEPLLARYAPVFIIDEAAKPHNRIGRPAARQLPTGEVRVLVDPDEAVLYAAEQPFRIGRARYLNLVYRLHFQQTPLGLFPFHLEAGNNPGLLLVLTLDQEQRPLLLTTVHTCGCYLAFVPFAAISPASLPPAWNRRQQTVYGQRLPGMLADLASNERLAVFVQSGNHRVRDLRLLARKEQARYRAVEMQVLPLAQLRRLPVAQGTVSFFEEEGPRQGYVKGSHKPLERLLMSWWAFDWRVGEDKALIEAAGGGPPFYTSLKFWRRHDSDMKDFPRFLKYWGWRL